MSLQDALRAQASACAALGSPFNARLLQLVAERLTPGSTIADRLLNWPGDLGPSAQSVPLRLAGSLHALVIDGSDPALAAVYPPNATPNDEALWQAVEGALVTHAARLDTWLDSPPQTNEVGRSAALIAAGHWLAARVGLPFALSELGASAGLNLFWDRYALTLPDRTHRGPADAAVVLAPDWTGPYPPTAAPVVAERGGVDLNPLDPSHAAHRLRLAAYIWPDQTVRLARLEAALATASPMVETGRAADWLEQRLANPKTGHLHLIFHTVAWQYFPAEEQARAQALIESAGANARDDAPLAWLGMEADGQKPGAGLTLRLWPGGDTTTLARVDFHGRWIKWAP